MSARSDGQRARRHVDVGQHHRVGAHHRAGADDRAMEDDRAVGDHRPVLDGAALEVDDVSDHALVPDDSRVLGRAVEDAAVLHARS